MEENSFEAVIELAKKYGKKSNNTFGFENLYGGIKMIESPHAIVYEEYEETVQRSWKERLFSWPWKPWVKVKVIKLKRENPNSCYLINNDTMVFTPRFGTMLNEEIRKNNIVSTMTMF